MKKIFYTDISDIKLEGIDLSLISKERIDKANLIKDDLKKTQSLTSYLLLRYAFKTIGINITNYNFSYNNNKPFVVGLEYYFNITHSNNIIAVVISDNEVGIDCEYLDRNRSLDLVLKYALTLEEKEKFFSLSDVEKYDYFYKIWVMKEAHYKMIGLGLTKNFNNLNVNYPVTKLMDKHDNIYYLSCTCDNLDLEEVLFNKINAI